MSFFNPHSAILSIPLPLPLSHSLTTISISTENNRNASSPLHPLSLSPPKTSINPTTHAHPKLILTEMTLSSRSISIPNPPSLSPTSLHHKNPNHTFSFPSRTHQRSRILELASLKTMAKTKMKQMVFNNNALVVEEGKYSYEVSTLINRLSSLPPRGSIVRCLEVFKNKLSQNDFALVFKVLLALLHSFWPESFHFVLFPGELVVFFSCSLENVGGCQWTSWVVCHLRVINWCILVSNQRLFVSQT